MRGIDKYFVIIRKIKFDKKVNIINIKFDNMMRIKYLLIIDGLN